MAVLGNGPSEENAHEIQVLPIQYSTVHERISTDTHLGKGVSPRPLTFASWDMWPAFPVTAHPSAPVCSGTSSVTAAGRSCTEALGHLLPK